MFGRSQYSIYSTEDDLKCYHCSGENKVLHPNVLEAVSVRRDFLLLAQVVNIHSHLLHYALSLATLWLYVIMCCNLLIMDIGSQD